MRQWGALICGYDHHKNKRSGVVFVKFKLKYLMPI
jgi:hypothetical protein